MDGGISYNLWLMGSHFSRILNFLLGGSLEETLSFRAAKHQHECRVCMLICRMLHLIDPGHCPDSIAWWREHGINIVPEHRPVAPWLVFWALVVSVASILNW